MTADDLSDTDEIKMALLGKIFTVDDTDLTEGIIVRLDEESKAIKKDDGMSYAAFHISTYQQYAYLVLLLSS